MSSITTDTNNQNPMYETEDQYVKRMSDHIMNLNDPMVKNTFLITRITALQKRPNHTLCQYAVINNHCKEIVYQAARQTVEQRVRDHYIILQQQQLESDILRMVEMADPSPVPTSPPCKLVRQHSFHSSDDVNVVN
jgi:hypothetical protein